MASMDANVALQSRAFLLSENGTPVLRVRVTPPQDHYLYGHDAGTMGLPTTLSAILHAEDTAEDAESIENHLPVHYPDGMPRMLDGDPSTIYTAYEGPTDLLVKLPADAAGQRLTLRLSGLLCSKTTCLPLSVTKSIFLPESFAGLPPLGKVVAKGTWARPSSKLSVPTATSASAMEQTKKQAGSETAASPAIPELSPRSYAPALEVTSLGKAALLAFLAGIILNFMPCVLPVASLKLKGILAGCVTKDSREAHTCFRSYNLWFACGIMIYFLFLSIVFGSLGLAWGEIFQEPVLILGLTVMVFAMALSLFGVFSLPVVDLKSGPQSGSPTPAKAFFTGMLATLLATPCSGPFLGGVLAWALLQPPLVIAVVFSSIGLGMASPYLFMAARPHLILPFQRPGAWTGVVEKLAAFMLAGTCLYLLNILPEALLLPALTVLLATAFAAWMWGGWTGPAKSTVHRVLVRLAAVGLILTTSAWALAPSPPAPDWREFDPAVFEQLLGKEPIMAEFTAAWCPNCIFLEKTVLTPKNLARWKTTHGLRLIKVDLTNNFPTAEALLHALGSRSIPLLAIFPSGKDAASPLILRDLYTAGDVDKALKAALAPKADRQAARE
jgi:thiol:disulfide interchange protein DsbD